MPEGRADGRKSNNARIARIRVEPTAKKTGTRSRLLLQRGRRLEDGGQCRSVENSFVSARLRREAGQDDKTRPTPQTGEERRVDSQLLG